MTENLAVTDALSNMTLTDISNENGYFYYLDANYQKTDNDGNTCVHKNPYISTTLNSTYEIFTSQLPYNLSFVMNHPQNVPHNFTLKYQNDSDVDLSSETWLEVDYSNVTKFDSNDVVLTIDTPTFTGSNYTEEFQFNFHVYTLDDTYPVNEDKYINITIYDDPFSSSPISNAIIM